MTLKTKTTKILLSAIIISSVAIMFSVVAESAHASTYGSWDSPTKHYFCHHTLSRIDTTANIHACNDLSVAASVWNEVPNSDWSLNRHTSYQSGDIVIRPFSNSNILAIMYPTPTSGTITSMVGYITTEQTMGNHNAGDSNVFDYHTLMIHEFGHTAGLSHSWWPWSVMTPAQPINYHRVALDWTDIRDL